MNTQRPDEDKPIEDYLAEVAASDLHDECVAPKEQVSRQIEIEIECRCGCTSALLATDHAMGRTRELDRAWISAKPDTFAADVVKQIERISTELSHRSAKQFEVMVRNPPTEPNLWRDQILIAVRYMA